MELEGDRTWSAQEAESHAQSFPAEGEAITAVTVRGDEVKLCNFIARDGAALCTSAWTVSVSPACTLLVEKLQIRVAEFLCS